MKILMVHPHEVYSSLEPWTTRIVNLAKELLRAGHKVKLVYFPLVWDTQSCMFEKEGIEFISLCRRAGICTMFKNCREMTALADWADIVHFQKCFHYASLPAIIAGFLKNKPLHYDWDDWEEMIYYESAKPPVWGVGLFLRILEKRIPCLADTVSVSSRHLRSLCLSIGIPEERIFHVPVGADLDRFHPGLPADKVKKERGISGPLVLYLGQLHGGQYVKLFIQAAKIIARKGVPANFMIVGDGARAGELRQLARKTGMAEKIIFTGTVASRDVPEYIAASDVAVACFEDTRVSRCKSPLKIAEYLAAGKAIVASNVGEVEAMVGDAGILVEPGDPVALAEKIMFLLRNEGVRKALEEKARKRAERIYNWHVSVQALLKAYEEALEHKNRHCSVN